MNIEELYKIINTRIKNKNKNSYTNSLIKLGPKKLLKNLVKSPMNW